LEELETAQNKVEVMAVAAHILGEMASIKAKMPNEFGYNGNNFSLQAYWVALKSYANSLIGGEEFGEGAHLGDKPRFEVYVGDTHDSAIEVTTTESGSLKSLDQASTSSPVSPAEEYLQEVTDLMEEMLDEPGRPPTPPPKDAKRLANLRRRAATPFEDVPEDAYGVVTEISSSGPAMHSRDSSMVRNNSSRIGRLFGHWKNPSSDVSTVSESTVADLRPTTPIIQASLVRRGSRRLSTSIKRLPLWNTELEEPDGPASPKSNAVFGVSIQKSMAVAKSTAKTHHKGTGSSRRQFPLCLHKCAVFIQKEGLQAPDIFAEPGDSYRVQKLKETFSKSPSYGEDINWDNYGVYDAADIILLFLSQLPRPLISEALAKRWVALSRQATITGSNGKYLDRCMDFWDEALAGAASPHVLKLLLNLWAEVADAEELNDMTAERLAGVLVKPLMHTISEKNRTDYMLGLAFVIRKRSEYTLLLKEGRPSRAAF
jgi:GTPase-activating protein SAC7